MTTTMLHKTDGPTHIPHNGTTPNTLDLIITNNTHNISDIKSHTLPSDHLAVEFQLGEQDVRGMGRKVYNYGGANWLSFRSLMNGIQLVSDIPDIATLDRMVREYTDNIRKVADKTISLKTIKDVADRIATAFEKYHDTPETTPQTQLLVNNTIHNYFLSKPIGSITSHDFLTTSAGPDGIQNILLKTSHGKRSYN
ncbi:hypothetical protein QE152_g26309 [Popillia japonica]|uniref:Uncharacterized protein n=1 Tax=Popillia japonica TaxID=7064 RepID=A0AAW1K030_POPJA